MGKKFEEILKSIVTNSNLGKEVDNLENFKEIYDVFKREGYEYSEQEFEKEMSDLLKEFSKENLSESQLNEIAGGKGTGSKFLAGILGSIAGFGALSTPKSSAFDASNVKNTVVTKDKQVKDFIKTNPLTTSIIGAVGTSGVVIGSIALYKYLNSIERAIDKLDYKSSDFFQKSHDIAVRILSLVPNVSLSDLYKNENNKKVQVFKELAIKFIRNELDCLMPMESKDMEEFYEEMSIGVLINNLVRFRDYAKKYMN